MKEKIDLLKFEKEILNIPIGDKVKDKDIASSARSQISNYNSPEEMVIEAIKNNDLDQAVKLIYSIYDKGYTVMDILDCFFLFVKTTDCLKEEEKYKWIPLICKYITIFHTIHEEELELALFTNESLKVFSYIDYIIEFFYC